MATPPLATLEDLAKRIVGGIDDADEDRAEAALEDASTEVRHAAGRTWLNDAGDDVEDVPDIAFKVTLQLAKDMFLNPNGYRSEQIGEYAYQLPDWAERELDKIRRMQGDLVSVELEWPFKARDLSARTLQRIADDADGY